MAFTNETCFRFLPKSVAVEYEVQNSDTDLVITDAFYFDPVSGIANFISG